jgi:hypothetical protein
VRRDKREYSLTQVSQENNESGNAVGKVFYGIIKMAVSDDVEMGVQTRSSCDVNNRI